MLEAIKRWHNRNVFFDAGERATFFMLLETQLSKGIPLTKVMSGFYNHPYTPIVREVAEAGIDALEQGKELAAYWAADGYFSVLEVRLLVESQRQKGVEGLLTAIRLLRESTKDNVSFWGTVVRKNIVYIIATLYLTGFVIYLGIAYQETFDKVFKEVGKSTDDLRLFTFANFFIDFGPYLLVFFTVYIVTYLYFRRNMTELGSRELANKFFLFNFFDRRFQYEVAGMMNAFLSLGIKSGPATDSIIDIYDGSHFQSQRMLEVKARLRDGQNAVEAFRDQVFNDFNYHMLALNCPDDTNESMASGYQVLKQISGELLERDFTRLGRVTLIVTILMALFVMMGLMEFSQVMQEGTS